MSIAIVTGSIAPYTNRLYDAFASQTGTDLHVFTCEQRMPWRKWAVPEPQHYRLVTLPGFRRHSSYMRNLYVNPGVVPALARLGPKVVVIAGHFSPTMALAGAYARAVGIPYGIATDGSLQTDPGERSRRHRFMRRLLVPRATFGICASQASVRLLERWGLDCGRCIVVPIVCAWDPPDRLPGYDERPYDLLFSGLIDEEHKGALFFADVVARCRERGLAPKVRVIGDGPLRGELETRLRAHSIPVRFDGYLQQNDLAEAYCSARLLAFPARGDPWGLVANEAVLCATPVLGSPHATSSLELVERFGVGLVRPLDVEAWSLALADMLSSRERWSSFAARRGEAIASFGLAGSVSALARAVNLAGEACTAPAPRIAKSGQPGAGS